MAGAAGYDDDLPRGGFRIVEAVRARLEEAGVIDTSLLVAVSGGGDSIALLELCKLAAPLLHLDLHAVYVDHRLRLEAELEKVVVAASASRLGIAFESITIDPAGSDENSLRKARLDALRSLATRRGCRWIALGHTADDQIETIVLRFLRGAGLGGLAGMRPLRAPFVRPLLDVHRADLRRFLRKRGVLWVEDSSNTWWRYARARLRRQVLPAVESAFGAGALRHLPEQARRWRQDQDFLDAEASRLQAFCLRHDEQGRPELEIASLAEAAPALRARVLHRWLGQLGSLDTPDLRHVRLVESLLERPKDGAALDLPGLRVWCERGRLRSAEPAQGSQRGANGRRRVAASPGAC